MQLLSVHCLTIAFACARLAVLQQVNSQPSMVCAKLWVAQVNARKIYDEANVLEGILENGLFLGILGAEAILQVTQ